MPNNKYEIYQLHCGVWSPDWTANFPDALFPIPHPLCQLYCGYKSTVDTVRYRYIIQLLSLFTDTFYTLYEVWINVWGHQTVFYHKSLCAVSHSLAINFHNLLRLSFYQRLVLKIRALWDVLSCRCTNSSRRFRDSRCLHPQGQAVDDEVINFCLSLTY